MHPLGGRLCRWIHHRSGQPTGHAPGDLPRSGLARPRPWRGDEIRLVSAPAWDLFPLDHETFPAVQLAYQVGRAGGSGPAVTRSQRSLRPGFPRASRPLRHTGLSVELRSSTKLEEPRLRRAYRNLCESCVPTDAHRTTTRLSTRPTPCRYQRPKTDRTRNAGTGCRGTATRLPACADPAVKTYRRDDRYPPVGS